MQDRIKKLFRYEKLKRLYVKYERVLLPGTLLFGVAVDFVTFRSIQIQTAFLILAVHILVVGIAITLLHIANRSGKIISYLCLLAPLIFQFSLGALLSASLIFYWFSGSFSVSWPILIIIAFLMLSNEVFRSYYLKPIVHMSVFYFVLFSVFSVIFSYVFNSLGPFFFVAAGLMSLGFFLLYVTALSKFFDSVRQIGKSIASSALLIFVLMNGLYFFNLIPPIPLSIREAGVYHNIVRSGGEYQLKDEERSFIERLLPVQTVHINNGDRVFVFTSIFAPAELNTTIVHNWQFYDEQKRKWIDKDRLSFLVNGGREAGYRGYSMKKTVTDGMWRVDVETKRGQVLGRVRFRIETVAELPDLIEILSD
ncbi:DUF2914 domain-containing protein [Candidatus Uhrbacteria bacterium]|nr:DUF2914 domain-containing protein [Candidatus Uhrbacteria bacterium]